VARNRKRRNDRRPRRPAGDDVARPGIATARGQRTGDADGTPNPIDGPEATGAPDAAETPDPDETPEAIEHGTPDVELAEAQLAVGRPAQPADEADLAEAEAEALDGGELGEEPAPRSSREVAASRGGNRLVHFLQGSWRELQRVQWPDRRQVMQATGVVIGFVIVAGVFLGVADWVATKIVHIILD
jgi:preprotein translocase subunit SecE